MKNFWDDVNWNLFRYDRFNKKTRISVIRKIKNKNVVGFDRVPVK